MKQALIAGLAENGRMEIGERHFNKPAWLERSLVAGSPPGVSVVSTARRKPATMALQCIGGLPESYRRALPVSRPLR